MINSVVARNQAGINGSGVNVDYSSSVMLSNTILAGHTVGIHVCGDCTAKLEATLWGSGAWANTTDWSANVTTTGTINVWGDPAFVNPDNGDYHVSSDSAAVHAGVDAGVSDDIDDEPRPVGAGYDIGADEYYCPALEVTKQADPDPVQPGAQLTYTIRVTNTGNVDLHTTIIDTLPTHVTLVETSGGTLALSGGTVVLPDGTVVITWTAGIARVIVNSYKVYLPVVLRNLPQGGTKASGAGAVRSFPRLFRFHARFSLRLQARSGPVMWRTRADSEGRDVAVGSLNH